MINFIFREMTSLKYFIPIVKEGNSRGINSTFYIDFCGKYNCPSRYPETLQNIIAENNIQVKEIREASSATGHTIYCEDSGIGCQDSSYKGKKISLTYQNDFFNEFEDSTRYHHFHLKYFDHIVFPSLFFAKFHNCMSDKNLYLGCPKYDVKIQRENVLQKYNIPKEKNCLLIFPKPRDFHRVELERIIDWLSALGYNVLIKNREKDRVRGVESLKYYFEDYSWHPHTTLELLSVSDFMINFGSTTVKEAVMMQVPLINFPIKPHNKEKTLPFFYEYDYCKSLDPACKFEEFKEAIEYLTTSDHKECFKNSIINHMSFENSSKNILDFIFNSRSV